MFQAGRRTSLWQNPWIKRVCPSLTSRPAGRRNSGAIVSETPWSVPGSGTRRTHLLHARLELRLTDNGGGGNENELKKLFCLVLLLFNTHIPASGWLWWSSAVPAGAGPLGGARRGELRPHRLHCGEQTQRFHPHCGLHPLDRGNAHQGLLPALSGPLDSALTANISSDLFYVWRPEMTTNCLFFFLKATVNLCSSDKSTISGT